MKRIRVPEEILSAVDEKGCSCARCRSERALAAETTLRYISEHPQVPTDEQAQQLIDSSPYCDQEDWPKHHAWCASEWQRRCFVQEEPEIPAEIKNVVDELFRNGCGDEAQRLVLMTADGRNLGGWCREAVTDRLVKHLRKGGQK